MHFTLTCLLYPVNAFCTLWTPSWQNAYAQNLLFFCLNPLISFSPNQNDQIFNNFQIFKSLNASLTISIIDYL